jgi:hypothetical protein
MKSICRSSLLFFLDWSFSFVYKFCMSYNLTGDDAAIGAFEDLAAVGLELFGLLGFWGDFKTTEFSVLFFFFNEDTGLATCF